MTVDGVALGTEKAPSMSVTATGLPLANTVTPIIGSPLASCTVPVTVFLGLGHKTEQAKKQSECSSFDL